MWPAHRGQECSTRVRTPTCWPGSRTTELVLTTSTGSGGQTGSPVRSAATRGVGERPTAGGPAAGVLVVCRPRPARSFTGRARLLLCGLPLPGTSRARRTGSPPWASSGSSGSARPRPPGRCCTGTEPPWSGPAETGSPARWRSTRPSSVVQSLDGLGVARTARPSWRSQSNVRKGALAGAGCRSSRMRVSLASHMGPGRSEFCQRHGTTSVASYGTTLTIHRRRPKRHSAGPPKPRRRRPHGVQGGQRGSDTRGAQTVVVR